MLDRPARRCLRVARPRDENGHELVRDHQVHFRYQPGAERGPNVPKYPTCPGRRLRS